MRRVPEKPLSVMLLACISLGFVVGCSSDGDASDDDAQTGALESGSTPSDLGETIRSSVLLCRGSVPSRSRELFPDELPADIQQRITRIIDAMPAVTLVDGVPVERVGIAYYVVFRSYLDRAAIGYAVRLEGTQRPGDVPEGTALRRAAILRGFDLQGEEVVSHQASFASSNGSCPPCDPSPEPGGDRVCKL